MPSRCGHRGAAERLDLPGQQGRGPGHGDRRAHPGEGQDVRAGDPGVQDVADDPDAAALQRAQPPAQREDVEQRLGRMLVLAVAGVDDRGRRPARDQRGGPGVGRADHDRRRVIGRERLHGVLQRLALLDAGATGADRDDVGREPLGGQLEARAGARRRLVEEVDHGAPAQGRHLLDLSPGHLGEGLGPVQDALDPAAVEVVDRDQMLGNGGPPAAHRATAPARSPAGPMVTSSAPSTSCTRTLTRWSVEVGMFLPT